jgi:hypothetical protein
MGSALGDKMWQTAFELCCQSELAPLHSGGVLAKILSLNDVMGVLTIDEVGVLRTTS